MDEQMTTLAYAPPRIADYGELRELTASCKNEQGADGVFRGNSSKQFGPSNPVNHLCNTKGK